MKLDIALIVSAYLSTYARHALEEEVKWWADAMRHHYLVHA